MSAPKKDKFFRHAPSYFEDLRRYEDVSTIPEPYENLFPAPCSPEFSPAYVPLSPMKKSEKMQNNVKYRENGIEYPENGGF